jgi:glycosyltransferase involved in cell wall biosynthesis
MTEPAAVNANRRVLLTVSGVIPDGIANAVSAGSRPRVDYLEMAAAFNADLLDHAEASRRLGRTGRFVERVLGKNVSLGWCCFRLRNSYDLIMTDGEQVGLPYAAFTMLSRRRASHLMIVHILSVPKKVVLFRMLRLRRRIDEMIVYSSAQRDFAVGSLRMPASQVTLVPFMVDTEFFAPGSVRATQDVHLVCSAGLEFRDYPTLVEAVRGLEVRVVLAAASPWSKRKSELGDIDLPSNVEVVRLDLHQLRDLYSQASLVVMPLHEVDFQAGVTTLLESMAMAKPIICTRTAGQTDVIVDGVTGRYVPVGDVAALRAAVLELLSSPAEAAGLGAAARAWVVEHADILVYVSLLRSRVEHHRAGLAE